MDLAFCHIMPMPSVLYFDEKAFSLIMISEKYIKDKLNAHESTKYVEVQLTYRTRAIITRGLYIFYQIFEDLFFFCKEFFSPKFFPYVWSVQTVSIQERLMMAPSCI